MKSGDRADLTKMALNIMKTLDDFPLNRRIQILVLCEKYLNFDVADSNQAVHPTAQQQAAPVKDEHFDA